MNLYLFSIFNLNLFSILNIFSYIKSHTWTVVIFTLPTVRGTGTSVTLVHDVLPLGVLVVVELTHYVNSS